MMRLFLKFSMPAVNEQRRDENLLRLNQKKT